MKFPKDKIRNFAIIAHIDHGKSTIADRFLQETGLVSDRDSKAQYLDKMDLERERGITIKAQTAAMHYTALDGETYLLNLIDTPGHVDFTYEVSRSLAACEGALLIVDAAQGVEAQTVSNVYLALEQELEIITVLNKIDLPSADPDRVLEEIEEVIGLDTSTAVMCSAKTGLGIRDVLESIVSFVPPPAGLDADPLRALIIDSWFDTYVGVIIVLRVVDGEMNVGDKVLLMEADAEYEINRLGSFSPEMVDKKSLSAGEVGYLICGIKILSDAKVGDTITHRNRQAEEALPGFDEIKPMVFSGVYPIESKDFENLRKALKKLQLNDAAFSFEAETSDALGFGFRCGYLGLLHMEVIQERLEREYNIDLINTSPSVVYKVDLVNGETMLVHSPSKLPNAQERISISEPIARVSIHVPQEYVGPVLKLCEERRGVQDEMIYSSGNRVQIIYNIPYGEVVSDFFDRLKSCSRGYASMDYDVDEWQVSDLVRLDLLVNKEPVDAFIKDSC